MQPVLITDATTMPLQSVAAVAAPVGHPVAELKCYEAVSLPERQVEAGVWECSPGVWHRQVNRRSYAISSLVTASSRRKVASR